ncbi:CGNR zinc finger domain-containing protein, partial [Mesorhizobium sp. M2D.F.Ca.ET.226.01.1.1]|uniref:CGNR zinc finger domain-containing protein n=1 Tax=Mesorhizobium sp. M2D.F.Ca.ET.226.01.1.1 TaxID=2496668 RepID=UPI000FD5B74D
TSLDAPLAERIRVEAALALSDVIRSDETSRMRVCEAADCTGLLLDLSRNGSKRFCSVRCGNRMNQLAYRERVAAEG